MIRRFSCSSARIGGRLFCGYSHNLPPPPPPPLPLHPVSHCHALPFPLHAVIHTISPLSLPSFQDRDAWCRVQFVWSKYNLDNMSELILTGVLCGISGWIFDWTVRYSVCFLSITEFTIRGFYWAIFRGFFWTHENGR